MTWQMGTFKQRCCIFIRLLYISRHSREVSSFRLFKKYKKNGYKKQNL
jgi:hypothetical protein